MLARPVFFLLVLANLVFFAWAQGHFGTIDEGREPQRLEQQLHADKLRILSPAQAPAAKRDEPACRLIGGLGLANAETLKAAVAGAGAEAKLLPLAEPMLHLVVIGDLANKAAADKKLAEVLRLGFDKSVATELRDGHHEIILGTFPAETAAREFMAGLGKRGIKTARLDSRQAPPRMARVEARGPGSILLQQLPKLIAPFPEATIGDCAE